jgi:hypothetical protein
MDIATIPFNVSNPTAYYAAPNKLWEYLSQGVTVAATPIPEVFLYKGIRGIHLVRSPEEYLIVIERSERKKSNQDPHIWEIVRSKLWSKSAEKLKVVFKRLKKRIRGLQ